MKFIEITSTLLTPEDRAAQIDIADWLLRHYSTQGVPPVPSVPERNTDLERFFSPESLPEVAALIEDLDLEIISIIPPENA